MHSTLSEMLGRVRAMDPETKDEMLRLVSEQTADALWLPTIGPQLSAYDSKADLLLYGGAGGGGKGLLPDEVVATPFGFRPIGELKVGDGILAANGTHSAVIGVYPQPMQPVYRVTFADGASIVTDGPHKWVYSRASTRLGHTIGNPKIGTTEQLREKINAKERIRIPTCNREKFDDFGLLSEEVHFEGNRFIASVEPEGEAETVCIAIDHKSSLYAAGHDLIVTHNTDLLAGLALMEHKRTLLLRPQYTDLGALIDRVCRVAKTRNGLNSSPPAQFKFSDRVIDFGAANTLERAETWQGNPHDLIGFDEACQFPEEVVRFLLGWNRAADEDLDRRSTQRVRAVLASNPPLTAEGAWIVQMFAPWLDPTHHDPAKHGELRWYITDEDGKDVPVDGPAPVEYEGRTSHPKSRTFIPASLTDNPFLADTGYQATLDAMPEPMRSAIRDGNFMAAREDDAFQVIPSSWVVAAQQRWRDTPKPNVAMSALGLDVARGGRDDTVFAPRWGSWFGELTAVAGRNTPDGSSVAVLAAGMLREGAVIGIDNIGIGADAETALKNAGLPFEAMNGAEKATAHTRDGAFSFATRRSEMWWMLREALDPDHGYDLALPVDVGLQADLTAPTYEVRPGQPPKIYVEAKKDMKRRLGRSPDRGDAVVYSWNAGGLDPTPLRNRRGQRTLSTPAPAIDYDVLRS